MNKRQKQLIKNGTINLLNNGTFYVDWNKAVRDKKFQEQIALFKLIAKTIKEKE